MKSRKNYLRSISVIGMAMMLFLSCCIKDLQEGKNIVEVLSSDSNFSTLVAALQHAEIADVLANYGPLTVFAPTNAAFNEYFDSLGVSGIDAVSTEVLAKILYYHVLYTEFTSYYFFNGYINTLSEGPDLQAISLFVNATDSILNGDAKIIDVDIMASNGVIHVIDKVLLPPSIIDIIAQNGNFTHFVEAVTKAGMGSTLNGTGPYTVFTPTDEAFEALFTNLGVSGIADITNEQLIPILQYHIVEGNVLSSDLSSGIVSTLNGDIIVVIGSTVSLNSSAKIIGFDLQAKNGVVHVIDKVLIPGKK